MATRVRYVRTSSAGGDGTADTDGAGGTNAYASLHAALDAEAADLVTAGDILQIIVSTGSGTAADSTKATITAAYTTDADNYVEVVPASGHERGNTWSATKYRMTGGLVNSSIDHLFIRNIQCEVPNTASGTPAIIWDIGLDAGTQLLDRTLVRVNHAEADTVGNVIHAVDASPTYILSNVAILIDSGSSHAAVTNAINNDSGATMLVQASTIRGGFDNGINNTSGTMLVKGTLVDGATSCFTGTFTTEEFNATSDGDGTGTGSRANQTFTWAAANSDELDAADGGAKDFGTDLSEEAFPVTTDAVGTARPQGDAYDIGSFEVVVAASSALPLLGGQQLQMYG